MSATINLDEQVAHFIALVLRSKDVGEGWRKVSAILVAVTERTIAIEPKLFQTRMIDEGLQVRLSERGKILSEYL